MLTSDRTSPKGTRLAWRLVRLALRVPVPLLVLLANPVLRWVQSRYRRSVKGHLPTYCGVRLWLRASRADVEVYANRLKLDLDLIHQYGPVYVRWLRQSFDAVLVSSWFIVMPSAILVDVKQRCLNIHPYSVWNSSPQDLAILLVGAATQGRLGEPFITAPAFARGTRRYLLEIIAFASRLRTSDKLVQKWKRRLEEFEQHLPEAAA